MARKRSGSHQFAESSTNGSNNSGKLPPHAGAEMQHTSLRLLLCTHTWGSRATRRCGANMVSDSGFHPVRQSGAWPVVSDAALLSERWCYVGSTGPTGTVGSPTQQVLSPKVDVDINSTFCYDRNGRR